LPLAISQTCLNLLMQTDFILFRRMAGAAAEPLGLPAAAADTLQGVYRGVQLFAFLPYQLLMSVSFILFPMLARARSQGDAAAVQRYTRTGVRIAMLLTGLLCAPIAGLAPHVLRLAFPQEIWTQGGGALRIHALGMGAFAILGIVSAALTSLGRERRAAVLTGGTVVLVATGCLVAVPRAPFGSQMVVHSALATGAALAAAAIIGAAVLRREAGGVVAPLVPIRVGAAIAATIALGLQMPWLGKPLVVAEAALLGLVYLGVLVALGELGRADIATLKEAFGRRLRR
jgi:stage V sporulation protein B